MPDWADSICENEGTMKGVRQDHSKLEKEEKVITRSRMQTSIGMTNKSSIINASASDHKTVCGASSECTRPSIETSSAKK